MSAAEPPSDQSATVTPANAENEFGQPVGWALDYVSPQVPLRTAMIGRYCRVEPLAPQRHGAELHQAYAQAPDDADWTYLSTGPWPEPEPFMEWLLSVQMSEDPIFFAIVDAATGLCTGLASYLRIDPGAGVIEVGHIHLSRALQRTPAATEAMYLMMQRVFELGYRRYEWKCDDLNAPSRAAAARLGFSYEGTFRQAIHYKGRNRDTAWFSMLDREWPAIDAEYRRWLDPDNFDEAGQQRTSLGRRR